MQEDTLEIHTGRPLAVGSGHQHMGIRTLRMPQNLERLVHAFEAENPPVLIYV